MIFSSTTQRAIRNKGMAAVYGLAAEFDCEPGDVLDLLVTTSFTAPHSTTPSQPEPTSLRTAADTSTMPLVDETTDGAAGLTTRAEPSVDPNPAASATVDAQGDAAGLQSSEPAAPKRTHTKGRGKLVEASIREHPDWTDQMHAAALGVDPAYVRRTATRLDLTLTSRLAVRKARQDATTEALKAATEKPQEPVDRAGPPTPRSEPKSQPAATYAGSKRPSIKHRVANLYSMHPDWDAHRMAKELGANLGTVQTALSDARAAAGESLKEPVPPANPQKPVAPPPTGERRTLTERIRKLHQQHPNLTAALIAKELGANVNSVSTILSTVRGKVAPAKAQPEFTGRRAMIEHYGEIAKRLGKPR